MINMSMLKRLIETVESSEIDTLEIRRWGTKIRISKHPPIIAGSDAASAVTQVNAADNSHAAAAAASNPSAAPETASAAGFAEVTSPMVGTFYRATSPDADPYVEVGDSVRVGQTLCILEAMKLMNELEAEVAGTIKEVCVDNAEAVEYGQVLFRILPD